MSKATPLQIVKEKHGSKKELVAKLVGLLDAADGESKEDFTARLERASNAKLLHLLGVGEAAKAAGGRDVLAQKIAELQGQAKDKDYLKKLEGYSLGRLLDFKASLERAAARK